MGPVALDISTTPLGIAFYERGVLPTLLAGSYYLVDEDRFDDFLPSDLAAVLDAIRSTSELITFSGDNLDLPVIREASGWAGVLLATEKHTDMLKVLRPKFGASLSLNDATERFLGEPALGMDDFRRSKGLVHDPRFRTDAFAKCHEDIRQTVALWKKWKAGLLL